MLAFDILTGRLPATAETAGFLKMQKSFDAKLHNVSVQTNTAIDELNKKVMKLDRQVRLLAVEVQHININVAELNIPRGDMLRLAVTQEENKLWQQQEPADQQADIALLTTESIGAWKQQIKSGTDLYFVLKSIVATLTS